ncbi:MAG: hypothetical protein ACPGU4_02465, partial [Flavobacteriales bacterium]
MNRWINRGLKILVVGLVTVLLLELCFRFYAIDFYAAELNALNPSLPEKDTKRETVLVFGDSFSANTASYVGKLNAQLPFQFVNSAVSGTGVLEASFMAKSRIKRFKPKVVIYQIYVGNDLLDIKHRPTGEMSATRKVYHAISDHIRVVKYLNYRLGQIRANLYQDLAQVAVNEEEAFSAERYTSRQKMIFKEESKYLENTLQLKNGRDQDFKTLAEKLHEIENRLDAEADLIVMVVPHCAQVNETYFSRMRELEMEAEDLSENQFLLQLKNEFPSRTIVDVL